MKIKSLILSLVLLYQFGVSQNCPEGTYQVDIIIQTDAYGYETSWSLSQNGNTIVSTQAGELDNNELYEESVCIDTSGCMEFKILDSFGDGIFAPGYYQVFLESNLIIEGGSFSYEETHSFNCAEGSNCTHALNISEGNHNPEFTDYYYSFSPDSSGIYQITTCANLCNTKIYIYDSCNGPIFDESNEGTIYYNNENEICGEQAYLEVNLYEDESYIIRIGDVEDDCLDDNVQWSLMYLGPVTGCTDPSSCNYDPLAVVDDGSCIPFGDPGCTGPDLAINEGILRNTINVDQINNSDQCFIEEGCLKGLGLRDIIRFTTEIANIGDLDYLIGEPNANPEQFTYDNCHNHFHYDGYAEYVLFDDQGNSIPVGFKNGFCVIDLWCPSPGMAQFGCNYMGITAGCTDTYDAYLDCQWIDVTDIADGEYILVTRVNWDHAPDALGRVEMDSLNNWGQACIRMDRSSGSLQVEVLQDCETYVDCTGVPYGNAQIDCNGDCEGTAVMGDIDGDLTRTEADVIAYIQQAVTSADPTTCTDLNQDGFMTVYDAALNSDCLIYGAGHSHEDGSTGHDHCVFPKGIVNPDQTVSWTIDAINFDEQYLDIAIENPATNVLAYQLEMSGIDVSQVENLVQTPWYETSLLEHNNMIVSLSQVDSVIFKTNEWHSILRVHYTDFTDSEVCISSIVDVVNEDYQQVQHLIVNGCIDVSSVGNKDVAFAKEMRVYPNPFSNTTTIYFNDLISSEFKFELIDLHGKIVLEDKGENLDRYELDGTYLTNGVYTYRIQSNDGSFEGKLILNR